MRNNRGPIAIRRRQIDRCPTTGLRRYRDRYQAREALRSVSWQRQRDHNHFGVSPRQEVRFFDCPHCGGLHLTRISHWHAELEAV